MPSKDTVSASATSAGTVPALAGYAERSQRPLQIFFFLLPLVVLYETLQPIYGDFGDGEGARDIHARRLIFEFFDILGLPWQHVPMLLVLVVLLVWHWRRRDPFELSPRLYGVMWLESVAWALPMLAFAVVFSRFALAPPATLDTALGLQALSGEPVAEQLPWQSRLVLDIGAGIYEELFFRLIGITLLHLLLVDYLGMKDGHGTGIAIAITSVAFAVYHFNADNPFTPAAFTFYTVMGIFLGVLYIHRGFGIVAAVHTLYDMAESGLQIMHGN